MSIIDIVDMIVETNAGIPRSDLPVKRRGQSRDIVLKDLVMVSLSPQTRGHHWLHVKQHVRLLTPNKC